MKKLRSLSSEIVNSDRFEQIQKIKFQFNQA